MTDFAMADLSLRERYWLITGSVGPRPIALVTSLRSDGKCNAAPFSAFNYMCEDPPLFAIGIDLYGDESHRSGERKDTLNNIEAGSEFVVNMVDEAILGHAVRCGTDHPADISEVEAVGLTLAPSMKVAVPRIKGAPIAWECKLFQVLEVGRFRRIVLGEIVSMHFRDDLVDEEKVRVRVDRFHPVGRLGGPTYCRTNDRMIVPVPPFNQEGKPRV